MTPALLHLIRHGEALAAPRDADRPLNPRGRADVALVAAYLLAEGGGAPVAIWHSPFRRARETAELLAQHLRGSVSLLERPDLEPDDDPERIARLLASSPPPATLAIVGHQPHLGGLATLLVTGRVWPAAFALAKAGVVTLSPLAIPPGEPRPLPWEWRGDFSPPAQD